MENKKYIILTAFLVLFACANIFAQNFNLNGTTNGTTVNTCNATLYDSGGSAGQYQNSESYTITFCSDAGSTVEIDVISFATESGFDDLAIFDGPNTGSPLIIESSGDPGIEGQFFESTGTCVTIRFTSDGSVTAAGFELAISCGFPCQNFTLNLISPALPMLPDTALYACPGIGTNFTVVGNYPNNNVNYAQSDATTIFSWTVMTIDAINYNGAGMTTLPSTFTEPGGTFVSLVATDVNGCQYVFPDTVLVYVSVPPTFTGTVADQTIICPGEEVNYDGFVQVEPWIVTIPEVVNDCFCADDDHYGEPQCAEFVHSAFAPGQTITSINDIEALCMDLEHSYIGDLDMWITCPNGQSVDLISYPNGCGGTYFGEPIDDDSNPCTFPAGYGVLYHYCWTPTATNTIATECGGFATAIPEGNYLPEGNFSGLIGCPINGTWQICFRDNLGSDDGRVCDFVLQFADNVLPGEANMWQFQNTYDPDLFEWTGDGMDPNSGGTATANPTTPGDQIFTFTATDDFGCSFDTTVMVTVRDVNDPLCCVFPVTTAGPDDHVCDNQYTFNATMAAGNTGSWALISGPGTVTWANQNSPHAIVTVNGWGAYEFEWTEQNLTPTCSDADRVIIEFYPLPTTTFTFDPVLCYGDTITLTYIGNMSATATFNWDFDGASVVSGAGIGPYEIYWSTAAMHSVELTVSENGCTSPDTLVNINNPAELTHTLEVFDDPCFQSCEGIADATVVGGTLPYDYSWGSPTNILPNLCAGNYTITVTDANGCTTADSFTINEPPQLVINSITTTNLTCYQSLDGAISVDASGGTGNLLYLWSDMGYGPSDRTNLIAGDYCVTFEDENGCSVSQCVTLTQPDELLVTMSPNIAICEGQQTTIQAQGMGGTVPYTYLWDQGTGVYNVASSSLTLAPDTTTVFSVYVTDDHGCTSNISSMRVTVSPLMVIDTMLLRDNRCFGSCDGRAEIVMHGGLQPLQYSWGSPNHIYEGLCAGIYTVTVNDIIGCTVSEMFVIEQPTQVVYTSAIEDATCYGYADGEATIFVQGGVPPYTYLWPNGHNTETLVTTAGTYTVTVLDDHNCRITVPFTINQPTDIYVVPVGNRTICQSQSVTLTTQATGGSPYNGVGYDFRWTGSDGSVWNSNLYVVSPQTTTVYTLVVTDSHGCQSDPITSTVYVNPPLEILSVLTSNDTVCPGAPAIVHVDVQGGNGGPYLMTLQDGSVVPSPFTVYPDTTTMYYVTLADMCGTPSVVDSILIIARPKPGNVFVAEDVEGCPPFAAYFTEGTPDYGQTYLWNFGDNGYSTVKNPVHIYTKPGTYDVSLEVQDFFGCKNKREIENMITIYPGPTALFEATPEVVSFLAADVEFINHSIDATDYYWFFGDGDSSLFANPVHKFPTIGEYEVMLVAESDKDCTDTTTRIITVRNEFSFYFPTSFTPNGDGMNDCARPCGNGIDKSDFSLVIYDRWGNLVFQTDRYDPEAPCDACTAGSWDGTRNGSRIKGDEILPNGMYHWYAEFKDWNGIVFKEQGTITLIR